MDVEQLLREFPRTTAADWHRHPNGGGWVQATAHVDDTAYVGPEAVVSDYAQVGGYALVGGRARITGSTVVSGLARVSGSAVFVGDSRVGGRAWVDRGRWATSPTVIRGGVHTVQHCAPRTIKIGCERHSIKYWLRHYGRIGRANWYTPEQIAEYKTYIDQIAEIDAKIFPGVL